MTAPGATLGASLASVALHRLSGFAAALREAGLAVSAEELISAVEVLNALDLVDPDSLYWGLRISLVRSGDDLPAFERAFRKYWHGVGTEGADGREGERPGRSAEGRAPSAPRGTGEGDGEEHGAGRSAALRVPAERHQADRDGGSDFAAWSAHEVIRRKDFADYDESDHERLDALLEEARFDGPWRRGRRRRLHRSGRLDIRGTLRAGFRTGGHPVRRVHRRPRAKHRQLTFVCDVSGSMERYSKAVLQLSYVIAERRPCVDAFAFATRLTRLTRELRGGAAREAIGAAASKVVDWSGGTRIGSCLAELNRGHESAVRGAVVVIASDGWDLGAPDRLAREADLLHRLAHTLIWVNPHLQDPRFEPLTRGMSAALPFVDHFVPCHNFESFATLFSILERS